MSPTRKRRQRLRLRHVDSVVATIAEGLRRTNQTCRALERTLATWRNESEMRPKDKYWVFSKKDRERHYRKGAHKVPHWTKSVALFHTVTDRVECL
jgi:Mitochondrial ribosomal protein L31